MKSLLPSSRLPTPLRNQTAILHGGDYNPDQWLPSTPTILQDDAKLMQQAGINSATLNVFSWTVLEPAEGTFNFTPLDKAFEAQHNIGNSIILATPSGAMPAWLAEKYPEARRVKKNGLREHYGYRHNHCWTSPAYRDKVATLNHKLAERYGKHPALAMWHISNELNGHCYCNLCRAEWAKWLESRYGTLDKMNEAHWSYFWSHQATAWNHVEPTETVLEGRVLDWHRFNQDQMIAYYNFEADILRKYTGDAKGGGGGMPITTNFMGTMFLIDYQKFATAMDVICDDQYPVLHTDGHKNNNTPSFLEQASRHAFRQDLYRNFAPRTGKRPFFLMESAPGAVQWNFPQKLKRPGIHRLEMFTSLAHGADGTSYFQFRACRGSMEKLHAAVVTHAGTEKAPQTRMFKEVEALSKSYAKLSGILGTSVNAEVALLYDWESAWAQNFTNGTDVPEWRYPEVAAENYRPFWQAAIPVDPIPPSRDFSKYKLVILPQLWIMTPELAERLKAFVEAGGTVVATYDTAMSDLSNRQHLGGYPGLLTDLFGLWIDETDRLEKGTPRKLAPVKNHHLQLPTGLNSTEVAALPHLTTATPLAAYAEDFYSGTPAITFNAYGKAGGGAYYIATRLDHKSNTAFYSALQQKLQLTRILPDLPEGVTAQLRGAGNDAYLFLLNYTTRPQSIPLPKDLALTHLESNTPISDTVELHPLAAEVYKVTM